jgi:hypothetical protein
MQSTITDDFHLFQGSLITTILSRKKSFKTEESYINFIKV